MSGERQAVEIAIAEQGTPVPGAEELEQIDLLEETGLEVTQKVVALRERQPSKIGRPPGARNRRTLEMANYLLNRYSSPLVGLAQIAAMSTAELAASLGCTLLEALQEQRLCRIALAPYVHQKMPVALDVTNTKIVQLVIGNLGDPAPEDVSRGDVITLAGTLLPPATAESNE